MSTCKQTMVKNEAILGEKIVHEHLEMERKVSTKDDHLVAGVLVIVRLEGQHWLGLVLAQPESLQVEREVREGNMDEDDCEDVDDEDDFEDVDDEDDSFHAYNQMRTAELAIWW